MHTQTRAVIDCEGETQIRRTVVAICRKRGGGRSVSDALKTASSLSRAATSGTIAATGKCIWERSDCWAGLWERSFRTCVWQQLCPGICSQWPCMAAQQAFSAGVMESADTQAIIGDAVTSISNTATKLVRRRICFSLTPEPPKGNLRF
jgi:hypothetical protein